MDQVTGARKASAHTPYLRELVISFGAAGYVALFEIEPDDNVFEFRLMRAGAGVGLD